MKIIEVASHHRRWASLGLPLLLLAARAEGCGFSLDQRGLCAHLQLGPEENQVRVGNSFRVQINADGCSSAAGCACAETALEQARWTSDNPQVASVDSTGVVVGRGPGRTVITGMPTIGTWSRTKIRVTVTP